MESYQYQLSIQLNRSQTSSCGSLLKLTQRNQISSKCVCTEMENKETLVWHILCPVSFSFSHWEEGRGVKRRNI